jgi:hypothetical protein
MNSRTTYMCMSVRGGIRHLQGLRKNQKTYMTDDQGRALSRDDAINAMMDELAKGRETIPMGPHCANPCPNADKGCPGFNYGANGGCGGFCTEAEVNGNQSGDGALGGKGVE